MTQRRPQAFRPDDPKFRVDITESPIDPLSETEGTDPQGSAEPQNIPMPYQGRGRGFGWGSLFLTAIGGLVSLAAGLWVSAFVTDLFSRNDWIGVTALVLLGVAIFAALMIAVREMLGMMRLQKLTQLRRNAEEAIEAGSLEKLRKTVRQLRSVYSGRKDMRWGLDRLTAHQRDVVDAKDLALLAEREVLLPLDAQAKLLVAQSASRISVVTALSPTALLDMAYVTLENMKLLHRLARLYGGRPGFFGMFKLARMVIAHLTITGGLALSSDLIQQFVGQRLTAKLSARLGEGIFNGALSARIGIAAIEICRPLPFLEGKRPGMRDFLGELIRGQGKKED